MKKKVVFALITLFICFVCIGCSVETEENNVPKKRNSNSIGLPSFSDYQGLSESEKIDVIEKTNNIPEDDVVKYFEEKIANYVDDKELIGISNLYINNDSLLMHEDKNEKQFNNLNINLELSIDNKDMTREETDVVTVFFTYLGMMSNL